MPMPRSALAPALRSCVPNLRPVLPISARAKASRAPSQMPLANRDYPQLEDIVERLQSEEYDCEVFRDPSARNQKPIIQAWGTY